MDIIFEETELWLMQQIKQAFDPNNILNTVKFFDAYSSSKRLKISL